MIKRSPVYLFLLILFVGQSIQGCIVPTTPTAPIPSLIPSIGIAPTFLPAADTPTPPVPFREESSCWPIMRLKKGGEVNGSLLFGSYNPEHIFAWDISSFRTKTPDENAQTNWMLSSEIVSPDGKVIASMPYHENKLVLTSSDNSKVLPLPKGDYSGVVKILTNGSIVILGYTDQFWIRNYSNGSGLTVPYYILDPATGDVTAYSVFLPGFTLGTQGAYPFSFSPDMDYAIYRNTQNKDGSDRYTLLDLKTNEIVWVEPNTPTGLYTAASFPVWHPKADRLTYILWSDWYNSYGNYYSISLDGTVSPMTWFNRATPRHLGLSWMPLPPWSPNGRYMAFPVFQPGQPSLYIWDDQEKIAYRPCLPDENQTDGDYQVYWSFDSNHLLLRLVYPDPNSLATPTNLLPTVHTADVILDMTTKTVLLLPPENDRGEYSNYKGGAMPLGWVNWQTP